MKRDKNGRFMKANTTKSNVTFSVTKNDKPLDESLYTWDESTKTFSSKEDGLVLDFKGINGVTFRTSWSCTFKTGDSCTFKTSSYCTFETGHSCTFKTGDSCTFKTSSYCTFYTGSGCTFKTDNGCIFNAYYNCTFTTGSYCTFKAGENCIFTTGKNCFVTRFDVEGVTQIPLNKTIKLNDYEVDGYTIVEEKKESPCSGKVVEIDGNKYKLVKV